MSNRRSPIPPGLILLLAVIAVSTGAIFARLAGEAHSLVIAAYRCTLATIILLPYALAVAREELWQLQRRDWLLAIGAGFFLAMHFATWISSLAYTSVASSVVLVTTHPIWVGLLTPFLSSDRITGATAAGIGVSVIGGAIVSGGDLQLGGTALFGDGLAVIGAITAAVYFLIGRRLRQKLSLVTYVVVCYGSASLVLLGIVFAMRLPLTGYMPETYLWLVALAVVPQIIGHSSYNWALGYFSASLIAVTLLGEPIGATILAYFILGETVRWTFLLGAVLILTGVYLAARGEMKEQSRPPLHSEPVS